MEQLNEEGSRTARRVDVTVLPGDGIGPEVTPQAMRVLDALGSSYGFEPVTSEYPIGYRAVEEFGSPLPADVLTACKGSSAVLLGAIGDPRASGLPPDMRPERALLELRSELGCFANLRPTRVAGALLDRSALRPEIVRGTDLLIVRELTGGIYYGEPRGRDASGRTLNTMVYSTSEVRRIAEVAFEAAGKRTGKLMSVDKANVLEVSRLWRDTLDEVGAEHPDVELSHMLVDRAAMELLLNPTQFDVIVTANLFGDILSDEAAALSGSIGVLPSASLGGSTDLYEPVHGSAPDIAGRDLANPIAAIRSVALMLRHTFGLDQAADTVEAAVEAVLNRGVRTVDLVSPGEASVGTSEFGDAVVAAIEEFEPAESHT